MSCDAELQFVSRSLAAEAAGPLLAERQGGEQFGLGAHLALDAALQRGDLCLRARQGLPLGVDLSAQTARQMVQRVGRDHHNQDSQYDCGYSQLRSGS